jgi:hypothetical protein
MEKVLRNFYGGVSQCPRTHVEVLANLRPRLEQRRGVPLKGGPACAQKAPEQVPRRRERRHH